ncbi:hypothetical protein [Novosphingobium rosa]|uniref:hypothetical protein n=1 Tax=Novosphingobium rosa TaxID=76978 RepID=UPI000833E37D|nr:hypothetical protein [Novosphingobium rosa]
MALQDLLAAIEATPVAQAIAGSAFLFPVIEVVHVAAIVLVVGTIAMLDLRLLGVARRDQGVLDLSRETLMWTWACFVLALVTGSLMFASAATRYAGLWAFQGKIVLLALAGCNMLVFHAGAYRSVAAWNTQLPPPPGARIAGALSLTLWTGVVICGRWIGFL